MTIDGPSINLAVDRAGNAVTLRFRGRLEAWTVGTVWDRAMAVLKDRPNQLVADVHAISYCDGSGISLLLELRRHQAEQGRFTLVGANADVQRLYERFCRVEEPPPAEQGPVLSGIERIGRDIFAGLQAFAAQIAFLGELALASAHAARHPRSIRFRDILRIAEEAGVRAVPLVMLLGFVIGLIMALQSAIQLRWYGAELLVANVVGLSLARELGPMMTAIVLTGRSGSAFAAELGAMKVNDEINALTTMGIDPLRFLVLPRLIAALLVTPLLAMFMNLAGLMGGLVVFLSLGFPPVTFINQVVGAVGLQDLLNGLTKAIMFGALVAMAGCRAGFTAGSGARAVGEATTGAVVSGIVLIILADGVFAAISFALGI